MIFEYRGRFLIERASGTGCAKIAPTAATQEHEADEPGEPNDQQPRKDRKQRVWGQVCTIGLASTA